MKIDIVQPSFKPVNLTINDPDELKALLAFLVCTEIQIFLKV